MSSAPIDHLDERVLIAYLLGGLRPAEAEAIEYAYFADTALFERLGELERELIHAYLRGELAGEIRASFERAFLSNPARRQRVAQEREWFMAARAVRGKWWLRVAEQFQKYRHGGRLWGLIAVAAVVVVAAAPTWLLLRRGSRAIETPPEATSRALPTPVPEPIAFALSPGVTRDSSPPRRLAIPASAQSVKLDLELDAQQSYREFRATIRVVAGPYIWSGMGALDTGRVSITVPASVLTKNSYLIFLDGFDEKGTASRVGSYLFVID
jgi:anti-sigma factor RsiW